MTYTTNSVKVAKNGIFIGYLDQNGAASQQSLNFDNKTLTLDSGLVVAQGNANMAGDLAVSGGVNMGGVAHVEGAATLSSTLAVSGAASLGSSLAVSGDANLNSALTVSGTSHLVGALTQDGAATFGSTVAVNGQVGLGSTLGVMGKGTFASAVDVMGVAHMMNTMTVDGQTRLKSATQVDGATTLGNTLDVAGDAHLAATLLVDGAASMANTLTVAGAATMNSGLTVNGTSTTNGASVVSGASSVGGSLTVSGASNMGSTLDVTGATHVASTLLVDGATHLVGALTQDGAAALNSTLDVTGATYMASTLEVEGASHLVGALTQDGAVSMGSTLAVTGAASLNSTLLVNGSSHLVGAMTLDSAATLGSTLDVTGASHLKNTLLVDGASHLVGAVVADNNMSIGGTVSASGAATLGSTLAVSGASNLASTLAVTGASHLKNTVVVDGAATMGSSLAVSGATTVGSTLNVTGAATFQNNITVNGNLTVLGAQTSVNTVSLEVKDNAILIADANNADTIESGVMLQYKPSGATAPKYAGMKRLPATGEFVFFKDAANKIAEPEAPLVNANTITVGGVWFEMALDTPTAIAKYTYSPMYPRTNRDHMKAWTLVGSNDRNSWTKIDSRSGILYPSRGGVTATVGRDTIFTVSLPASYAYIRFIIQDVVHDAASVNANAHALGDIALLDASNNLISASTNGNSAGLSGFYGFPYHTVMSMTYTATDVMCNNIYQQYPSGYYSGSITTTVISLEPVVLPTDVYATVMADSFNCASDARLKKDIVPLENALDKMDKIRGVTYHWIDESQPTDLQVGVIAQEIQSVYPELVREGGNGFLSVDYPKLTAVLIQSLKELKAMVLELVADKQAKQQQ